MRRFCRFRSRCRRGQSRRSASRQAFDDLMQKVVNRNSNNKGKLHQQIYRAALFSCFNMAQKAPVNTQFLRHYLLGISAMDTEFTNAFSACFYVIIHCTIPNLTIFCEIRDYGYFAIYGIQLPDKNSGRTENILSFLQGINEGKFLVILSKKEARTTPEMSLPLFLYM